MDPATVAAPDPGEHIGPLSAGDRVGDYEVLAVIGIGGTAAVYRARHRARGTVHALKALILDRPSLRARLEAEARVQAALRHPNLVAASEVLHLPGGAPVAVLEHVRGPSLAELLVRHRPHRADVDRLVRGILRGVAHAHAAGVIHRDLKPANVLLARDGARLVPKVTDFGLVKLAPGAGGVCTRFGQAMGTPSYMPAEQYADAAGVDARADVWALGVLAYEACTGTLPFAESDDRALLARIAACRYAPPEHRVPDLPDRMARAIREALRPLADRPPDAGALLALWGDGADDEDEEAPFTAATLAAATALGPPDPDLRTPTTLRPAIARPRPAPPAPARSAAPAAPRSARWWPVSLAALAGAAVGLPVVAGIAAVAAGIAALHTAGWPLP